MTDRRTKHPAGARPRPRPPAPGFTLLEILVAILLFSILVTTVFGSFRAMYGRADVVTGALRMDQMALSCMQRIGRDLASVYAQPPQLYREPDLDESNDPYRMVGEVENAGGKSFSRLAFASTAHIAFGNRREAGVARITYYVVPDGEGSFVLRRSDRLHPPDDFEADPWDPVLCMSVDSLAFTFRDAEGDAHEDWDSDGEDGKPSLPAAVGVDLTLRRGTTVRNYRTLFALPVSRGPAS